MKHEDEQLMLNKIIPKADKSHLFKKTAWVVLHHNLK